MLVGLKCSPENSHMQPAVRTTLSHQLPLNPLVYGDVPSQTSGSQILRSILEALAHTPQPGLSLKDSDAECLEWGPGNCFIIQ